MILYVNGDSHAAAAEAVTPCSWAQDDGLYWGLGRRPHPENERASFGCELANHLYAILDLDAQAGCSNARIIRTTKSWVENNLNRLEDVFLVIQWTTWEREEWWHNGQDYQVNASGIDHVPPELEDRYKQFVVGIDWNACTQQAHNEIWQFHQYLRDRGVRHLMFNGNNDFSRIHNRQDWGAAYIGPYDPDQTYNAILLQNGFKTVHPHSWHFGPAAHCFWAEYLLQYINNNQLI